MSSEAASALDRGRSLIEGAEGSGLVHSVVGAPGVGKTSLVSRVDADRRPQYRLLPPLQRAVSAMSSEVDRAAAREGLRVHAMSVASRIRAEWIGPRGADYTRLLHQERTALRSAMRAAIDSGDAQCAVAVSASLLEHGFRRVDREVFDWAEAPTALAGLNPWVRLRAHWPTRWTMPQEDFSSPGARSAG